MTAHPDDATPEASAQKETAARPDRGMAENGKGRGQVHRGEPGQSQFGDSSEAGSNSERGGPAGSESDRIAPGAASHKKADDLK